jgi:hypothetical protein
MKVLPAILALALGLLVSGTAWAQDLRNPDQVAPAAATLQDLRNPDQVAPSTGAVQDLRNPDQVAPMSLAVPEVEPLVASASALDTTEGGLDALWIVLIAIGGVVALAGASYATLRFAHAHGHLTG